MKIKSTSVRRSKGVLRTTQAAQRFAAGQQN